MRVLLTLVVGGCLLPSVALASEPCPAPASPESFGAVLAEAHAAAVNLDEDTLKAKLGAADAMVPCLSGPITPEMAAEWHVLWGFTKAVDDPEGAQKSYAAGRLANPNFPAADVLGPSKMAMERYQAIPLEGRQTVTLKEPPKGTLVLDGVPTRERSSGWPVLYQWIDEDQKALHTAALGPSDTQPAFPEPIAVTPPNGNGGGHEDPKPKAKPVKIALLAGAGAGAAVALVGVAGLVGANSAFETASATVIDPADPQGWLDARASGEGAFAASGGRGALAVGGAAAAVGLGTVGLIVKF